MPLTKVHQSMKIELDLPGDVVARLKAVAAASCNTVDEIVGHALKRYLAAPNLPPKTPPVHRKNDSIVRITAPIAELVEGLLSGDTEVGEVLASSGNFGLGTLNMLDGEVVVLDGVAYQQNADGKCAVVPHDRKTPWMMVTRFDPAQAGKVQLPKRMEWDELKAALLEDMPAKNAFIAVRVDGEFEHLELRAVRRQETNRPLAEVTREQALFNFGHGEKGTLVGFWSPEYFGHGMSPPGFHLHYISADRARGGHVLRAVTSPGCTVRLQPVYHFEQDIPASAEFQQANFGREGAADELMQAEG